MVDFKGNEFDLELDFTKYPETGLPPEPVTTTTDLEFQDNPGTPAPPETVQSFNNNGDPQAEVDRELEKQENFDKAYGGQSATPQNSSTSGETIVTSDVAALKQKGYFQEKGFFGDQSLANETIAFNNAVQMAAGLTGLARSISSRPTVATTVIRSKISNYFLYDNEKEFLRRRAIEFSSIGIIPYDVMEEFLFILVSVDRFEDLSYIAAVTGVYELNDVNKVREPIPLLSVKNLYKVGYLANGVASINMQYGTKYNAAAALDYDSNPYAALYNTAASKGRLSAFPSVNIVSNLMQDIVKQIALSTALNAVFGAITNPAGAIAAVSSLGTLASQMINLNSLVSGTVNAIKAAGVAALQPVLGLLSTLTRTIRDITNFSSQLSGLTSVAGNINKIGDVTSQFTKLSSMITSIASVATQITSLISNIAGPGNIGAGASTLLNKLGGFAPSGIILQQTMGQRIPPSVLYKNPMMQSPSYSGKAFFGENMAPQGAIDQTFCRTIAAFPQAQNGAGNMSFGMQNFSSYGGTTSLLNMVSRVMLGVPTAPTSGVLGNVVSTATTNLCNILNVPTTSFLEARRSDNSIPFMAAMSSVIVNNTKTPFPSSTYSYGWKLASATGNEVQRLNPGYLETCRTSL